MSKTEVRRFESDEEGYQAWCATHPDGFVLNTRRQPTDTYKVLHRADCRSIRKGTNFTAPDYIKFCSLSEAALFLEMGRDGNGQPGFSKRCSFCCKQSGSEFDRHKQQLDEQVGRSRRDTEEVRRLRLAQAPKKPARKLVLTYAYDRNPDVVAEVLCRAKGNCEHCNQPAPFTRRSDNTPYLEVHHKKPLSEGGDDTVENAEALCPNCHRMRHFA
jgi:hypothetical protein